MLRAITITGIMLPKIENLDDLKLVAEHVGDDVPVIALIETASGLISLEQFFAMHPILLKSRLDQSITH